MGLSFSISRNDVSPALSAAAAKAKNPINVFRAMGTTFKSITEGNFNSVGASLRPKQWVAKKDGTARTLKKSGTLSTSFHLEVSSAYATLKNPTVYAARHQFGDKNHKAGKKAGTVKGKSRRAVEQSVMRGAKGIPPSPFYPVDDSGKLIPAAESLIARAGERAMARDIGAT